MAGEEGRLLVLDLAATSKNWALTPEGEERIRREAPPGWRIYTVQAQTSSDGDGPPRPNDEVMDAIATPRSTMASESPSRSCRPRRSSNGCTPRPPASERHYI